MAGKTSRGAGETAKAAAAETTRDADETTGDAGRTTTGRGRDDQGRGRDAPMPPHPRIRRGRLPIGAETNGGARPPRSCALFRKAVNFSFSWRTSGYFCSLQCTFTEMASRVA